MTGAANPPQRRRSARFDVVPSQNPASAADLEWQRLADKARVHALEGVQVTAERWGTTLLAVTGLLTTVSAVLGSRDVVSLRDTSTRVVVGLHVGTALLMAVVSLVLAALAAQGSIIRIALTGPALRDASNRQAARAARLLKFSRLCAAPILPFFFVGIAIVTYAPREEKPGVVAVTLNDGTTVCAESLDMLSNGIWIIGAGGKKLSLPPGGVAAVTRVGASETCTKTKEK